jgi:hypothetical protein
MWIDPLLDVQIDGIDGRDRRSDIMHDIEPVCRIGGRAAIRSATVPT